MKEQEFFEKMAMVWMQLDTLKRAIETITQEMAQLEQTGMTSATIHIRSDNGGMELLHRSGSEYEQKNGRRREYVGKNPDKQLEAKCKVKRYQSHQTLKGELRALRDKSQTIENQISYLEMVALGKQAKLFSEMGTDPLLATGGSVPTDWKWLTPKMVIDYFERSPNLAALAGDVEEVLGKVDWAESERLAA